MKRRTLAARIGFSSSFSRPAASYRIYKEDEMLTDPTDPITDLRQALSEAEAAGDSAEASRILATLVELHRKRLGFPQ